MDRYAAAAAAAPGIARASSIAAGSSCKFFVTSAVPPVRGEAAASISRKKVLEIVRKQAALMQAAKSVPSARRTPEIDEAYARCFQVVAQTDSNFYLGISLLTPQRKRAISAIFVWAYGADEIVDGENANFHDSLLQLERYKERLELIFAGRPLNIFDAALADTVVNYSLDVQLFRDLITGMEMDIVKSRYANFDELYMYSYYVAGSLALLLIPILGIASDASAASLESICDAGLTLAVATQLTNILRDVGEDARKRGRIYLPQDELASFGLSDEDISAGIVTEQWRAFVKQQASRAHEYYSQAGNVVPKLDKCSRWPVWATISVYKQILASIEENDFDNFHKRARVPTWKKLMFIAMDLFRV